MATFFLIVIYITFISLGLPDSLLGSVWPVMYPDLGAGIGMIGIISMIISGGTILSSLMSERLIRKFGTGPVTFFSVLATAAALLGFSFAPGFLWLAFLAVPLGLGAGSVDAALNNYVALNYKPHHMSWLHCFWGIGAFTGPMIMARFIQNGNNWRGGYLTVGIIQTAVVLLLLVTLPLWKKNEKRETSAAEPVSGKEEFSGPVLKIRGVKASLAAFIFYCGVEHSLNYWGSTFLVEARNLSPATAARWISLFFAGITVGRFLSGFLTMKFRSSVLIRAGQILVTAGALLLIIPFSPWFSLAGIIIIGLGCAPVFPGMLHETPYRFGEQQSQKIMGMQMAFAYMGGTFLPPLFGLIASKMGLSLFPYFLLAYSILMFIPSERINRIISERRAAKAES
ncbi:MFS transporter [Brucepastera parasyntrophica]|uniref:MFS transporter n=1 Tax=Brucepastera parasyntrophica TaxID=2880008 RepID=UPI00210E0AF2|nr:MFS transporter [Brucepastera parasyntrophica]ULQ60310.1 MFS transporter [Brucepastera parasyntrophica]